MKHQHGKETRTFLALTAFFGGGLLLSRKFITDGSAWELLAIMNGLGLGIVFVLWTVHILRKKSEARYDLPIKLSKSFTNKCG
jgi:hypothetical protein